MEDYGKKEVTRENGSERKRREEKARKIKICAGEDETRKQVKKKSTKRQAKR